MTNVRIWDLPRAAFSLVVARGISTFGSAMTIFGLDVWIYQKTGSFSIFALLAVAAAVPSLLFAPFAGVLADKIPRKRLLVCCELGAGAVVGGVLCANEMGELTATAIGAANIVLGLIATVSWPAAMAGIAELTPEQHRPRINGLCETIAGASMVGAPLLSASLLALIGLDLLLLLDIVSYVVCASVIAQLSFAAPARAEQYPSEKRRFQSLREAAFGFRWIAERPHLMTLLFFFAMINCGASIMVVALTPYLLSFSGASVLAATVGCAAAGTLAGGVLFSISGGPRRLEIGILTAAVMSGLCMMGLGLARVPLLIYIFAFLEGMCGPIMNACSQTIWQNAVPTEVQGRVFAIRKMIAWGLNPLSILLSVPLVSSLFLPLLALDLGFLSFSRWWGSGQSGALGIMISLMGILTVFFALTISATNRLNPSISRLCDKLA